MVKTRQVLLGAAVASVACLAAAPAAQAAFPGQNGKIVYTSCCDNGDIGSVNPDGSGETTLVSGGGETDNAWPAWSPDGTRIAFASNRDGNYEIYVMDADGSNLTRITFDPAGDTRPSWAPDGQRIVFTSGRDGNVELYTMNADGSGITRVTNTPGSEGSAAWSPDGRTIAFAFGGTLHTIAPDGTQRTPLGVAGSHPSWSPDGREIWASRTNFSHDECEEPSDDLLVYDTATGAVTTVEIWCPLRETVTAVSPDNTQMAFAGRDVGPFIGPKGGPFDVLPGGACCSEPDWQPLPVDTPSAYARPKSATRVYVPLVPAFEACASPNREHGPPLAFGSCAPPAPGSSHLFVGVGDGHPAPSRSTGYLRLRVRPGAPGGEDDTTSRVRMNLTNVMRTADLSEYTGELRGSVRVRITDTEGAGAASQTVQDFPLEWTVPCAPTASTAVASVCDFASDLDALVPGATPERTRAIWALDQVRVHDGGPDEDADTGGDNALFAVQGVFVP